MYARSQKNMIGYQVCVERSGPAKAQHLNTHWASRFDMLKGYSRHPFETGWEEKDVGEPQKPEEEMKVEGMEEVQTGEGLFSSGAMKAARMFKQGAQAIGKIYASEPATVIKNTYGHFMNSNPNWRPGFAGEKHLVDSRGLTYNYCGPGTNLEARLARGDPGLDAGGLDNVCKLHDIDYSKARTIQDIRAADEKMVEGVDASAAPRVTKEVVKGLIKAKMIGEDIGLVKPQDFTDLPNLDRVQEPVSGGKLRQKKKMRDPARELRRRVRKLKKGNDKLVDIAVMSIKKRLELEKAKKKMSEDVKALGKRDLGMDGQGR